MIRKPGIRGARAHGKPRRGAAILEFAIVFPVFMILLFGLLEFGRAYMIIQMLSASCRVAAREGVTDGVTTAQIKDKMLDFLETANINRNDVKVYVIDGSGFDDDPFGDLSLSDLIDDYPTSEKDMSTARPRSLAIFRVEIPYEKVAVITPVWLLNATLYGQVVMRRE
jgi:hypothetical protein